MTDTIELGVGEVKVSKSPTRLRTSALGSCVAAVLYDNVTQIGGMAHIMLPSSSLYLRGDDPNKYADLAIPTLINEMVNSGANRFEIRARLVGGAMIVENSINIGKQVINSVEMSLEEHGIEVVAKRVMGKETRTAVLDIATGVLWYSENCGLEKAL